MEQRFALEKALSKAIVGGDLDDVLIAVENIRKSMGEGYFIEWKKSTVHKNRTTFVGLALNEKKFDIVEYLITEEFQVKRNDFDKFFASFKLPPKDEWETRTRILDLYFSTRKYGIEEYEVKFILCDLERSRKFYTQQIRDQYPLTVFSLAIMYKRSEVAEDCIKNIPSAFLFNVTTGHWQVLTDTLAEFERGTPIFLLIRDRILEEYPKLNEKGKYVIDEFVLKFVVGGRHEIYPTCEHFCDRFVQFKDILNAKSLRKCVEFLIQRVGFTQNKYMENGMLLLKQHGVDLCQIDTSKCYSDFRGGAENLIRWGTCDGGVPTLKRLMSLSIYFAGGEMKTDPRMFEYIHGTRFIVSNR